jgi:hypothetical protein
MRGMGDKLQPQNSPRPARLRCPLANGDAFSSVLLADEGLGQAPLFAFAALAMAMARPSGRPSVPASSRAIRSRLLRYSGEAHRRNVAGEMGLYQARSFRD